uniref:Uncharacterized protein n=1 Tax=Arundo donax TaxID=35708 RepID=A0A0A9AMW9_ARUDO
MQLSYQGKYVMDQEKRLSILGALFACQTFICSSHNPFNIREALGFFLTFFLMYRDIQ